MLFNLFYISFFILAVFSFDLNQKFKKDARLFFFVIISIILLANISLLHKLPDIKSYKEIYENYLFHRVLDNHVERGYMFCNIIFAESLFPFFIFRAVIILFSCAIFFNGIAEFSKQFSISVLYFYTCVFVMSYLIQIRTGLGLSVFIGIGLPAYKRKQYSIVLLSIILAMLFHISMIVLFIPFVLCKFLKGKKVKLFFSFCAFILLYINVFDLFVNIVMEHFINTKLIAYINDSGNINAGLSKRDLLNFILCILFARCTDENDIDNFMFWSFFCGFILKIIFRNFGEVGVRFNLLFQYSLVFLMPILYNKKNVYTLLGIYVFAFVNFRQWIAAPGRESIISNGYISL